MLRYIQTFLLSRKLFRSAEQDRRQRILCEFQKGASDFLFHTAIEEIPAELKLQVRQYANGDLQRVQETEVIAELKKRIAEDAGYFQLYQQELVDAARMDDTYA